MARGWPILAFALLGGAAAIFYVAPPIRWAYRGLGELVIALSYGPWMVLGSLYLHTQRLSWQALAVSLVPGLPDHGARGRQRDPRFPPGPPRRQAQPRRAARAPPRRLPVPGARGGGPARRAARRRRRHLPVAVPRRPAGAAAAGRERPHRALDLRDAARLRSGGAQHRRLLPGRGAAAHRGHPGPGRLARHEPHRPSRRAAAGLLADHARLRPVLPALLHRIGAGQAPARRARRRRGDARRRRDRPPGRALRHAVRRRAAGRPPFPRARREARRAPGSGSRSRPTASASTRPWRNGSRACRSARCRSASTATPRRPTPASGSAPRWRPRTPPAARCAPPGCRWRSPSRRPASTCTRPGRSSSGRIRSAPSASTPAA